MDIIYLYTYVPAISRLTVTHLSKKLVPRCIPRCVDQSEEPKKPVCLCMCVCESCHVCVFASRSHCQGLRRDLSTLASLLTESEILPVCATHASVYIARRVTAFAVLCVCIHARTRENPTKGFSWLCTVFLSLSLVLVDEFLRPMVQKHAKYVHMEVRYKEAHWDRSKYLKCQCTQGASG